MISAWWLIPAITVGACAGYCLFAVLTVGKKE